METRPARAAGRCDAGLSCDILPAKRQIVRFRRLPVSMHGMRWTAVTVTAWIALLLPRGAAGQQVIGEDPSPHSEASLIAEVRSVRPGVPFTVGLHLSLEPGWHTYWKNPGDSGESAGLTWDFPSGFEAGPILWPAPRAIPFPPLLSYGYLDEVLLPVVIEPPASLADGDTVRLGARAFWLVCIEDCFPAEAELSLSLPVRDKPPALDPLTGPLFAAARARLPAPGDGWTGLARARDRFFGLRLDPPDDAAIGLEADLPDVRFFAATPDVIDHAAKQRPDWDGETLTVRLVRSAFSTGTPDTLRGVLVLARDASGDAVRSVEVAAPVVVSGRPGEPLRPEGMAPLDLSGEGNAGPGLFLALLFAFLGGVLLNLMPCVFPVLSLKVLGFVESGSRGGSRPSGHGLAFAAGVIVSFWVLGGLLLLLRSAGESVGWGFQLQSPLFVGLMALLFFLLGLWLLGAMELGLALTRLGGAGPVPAPRGPRKSSREGTRSFASGVLATVVATPCTAPLMGAALGWALLRPAAETMAVFTALGAGMAAPYVALSAWPGLVDRLPAPGRWMITLRQLLAFPLFATVVWLAWVFGLQTGVEGLTVLLAALLLGGLAVWIHARWGGPNCSGTSRALARAATWIAGGCALFVLVNASRVTPPPVEAGLDGRTDARPAAGAPPGWMRWSPGVADSVRAEGDPLLIDFTAAWCLSCQVNERLVLETSEVRDAFAEHGVTLMRADWTRRDAEITRALAGLGRSSVPVYALYPPDEVDPVLLPSVLTKEIVRDALDTYVSRR